MVEAPNGDLYLMRASAEDIRVPRPSERERELLSALDGTHGVAELEAKFGSAPVRDTLDGMGAHSLLEDAADYETLPPETQDRFDRQLRYFSDMTTCDPTPSESQERLRAARVSVLGVGGLGGRVAWELACFGVGELRLLDGDRVEVSNLNRQIQFQEADVGASKAEAAAARLGEFNSRIRITADCRRVESEAEISEFIAGSDLVVDAADWPAHEIEHWCNAACFAAGIPYITMSAFPPMVRVGPLYVPGRSGCFQCQVIGYRREFPLFDIAIDQRKGVSSPAATLGAACGVVGGLVGIEVLHYLTGLIEPAALGAGVVYDLRTMTAERQKVVPAPDCPVCADLDHDDSANAASTR